MQEKKKKVFYGDYPHFGVSGSQWEEKGYVFYEGEVYSYRLDRKDQFDEMYYPQSIEEFLASAMEKKLNIPDAFLKILEEYKK